MAQEEALSVYNIVCSDPVIISKLIICSDEIPEIIIYRPAFCELPEILSGQIVFNYMIICKVVQIIKLVFLKIAYYMNEIAENCTWGRSPSVHQKEVL